MAERAPMSGSTVAVAVLPRAGRLAVRGGGDALLALGRGFRPQASRPALPGGERRGAAPHSGSVPTSGS